MTSSIENPTSDYFKGSIGVFVNCDRSKSIGVIKITDRPNDEEILRLKPQVTSSGGSMGARIDVSPKFMPPASPILLAAWMHCSLSVCGS
jgi:hypothetical protein